MLLFACAGAFLGFLVARYINNKMNEEPWEKTSGKVLEARVVEVKNIEEAEIKFPFLKKYAEHDVTSMRKKYKGKCYVAFVEYQYNTPEGVKTSNRIFRNIIPVFDNLMHAQKIIKEYTPGTDADAYFNPKNSDLAVLAEPGFGDRTKLYVSLILAGALIGIFILFVTPKVIELFNQ